VSCLIGKFIQTALGVNLTPVQNNSIASIPNLRPIEAALLQGRKGFDCSSSIERTYSAPEVPALFCNNSNASISTTLLSSTVQQHYQNQEHLALSPRKFRQDDSHSPSTQTLLPHTHSLENDDDGDDCDGGDGDGDGDADGDDCDGNDDNQEDSVTENPSKRRRRRTAYSLHRNLHCHMCGVTETPEWRRGPAACATPVGYILQSLSKNKEKTGKVGSIASRCF